MKGVTHNNNAWPFHSFLCDVMLPVSSLLELRVLPLGLQLQIENKATLMFDKSTLILFPCMVLVTAEILSGSSLTVEMKKLASTLFLYKDSDVAQDEV